MSTTATPKRNKTAAPERDTTTGLWGFVVDVGLDPKNGKRRQVRRRGFKTKADALAELDNVRQSARAHTFVAKQRQTVGDYLDEWLVTIESTLRPSTHYSYEKNVRVHVKPRIGAVRLQAVDGLVLNKLYGDLAAKLSPRTVSYVHTILHRAFKDAMKVGRLTRNPCDASTPPKASATTSKKIVTWTGEEVAEFLAASAAAKDRHVALWTFLAMTGVRRGEALGLRWSDLELDDNHASICQTVVVTGKERWAFSSPKTAAGTRVVDLDAPTVRALVEHRKRQNAERLLVGPGWIDRDLVFTRANGDPLDPERVSRDFGRRIKRWGMRTIRLHDLRHTWATLALKGGIPIKVVQERLGHSSPVITQTIYSHVSPGMQRDAADLVRVDDLRCAVVSERSEHYAEVDRLWSAFKRDFFVSVEMVAGLGVDQEQKRWKRLARTWDELCALDIDAASSLWHGLDAVSTSLGWHGDPHGPSARHLQQLSEVLGLATIARDANPDAKVETLGELVQLGEEAIQREIDDELGEGA